MCLIFIKTYLEAPILCRTLYRALSIQRTCCLASQIHDPSRLIPMQLWAWPLVLKFSTSFLDCEFLEILLLYTQKSSPYLISCLNIPFTSLKWNLPITDESAAHTATSSEGSYSNASCLWKKKLCIFLQAPFCPLRIISFYLKIHK